MLFLPNRRRGNQTIEYDKNFEDVSVQRLLDGVFTSQTSKSVFDRISKRYNIAEFKNLLLFELGVTEEFNMDNKNTLIRETI